MNNETKHFETPIPRTFTQVEFLFTPAIAEMIEWLQDIEAEAAG